MPTKLISYENLSAYDTLIKAWVDGSSATSQSNVIFRTVLYDSDNIYFYHKANAVKATDTPDVTVPLAGSDVTKALAEISAIVTALGGEMAATAPYAVTFPALTTEAKATLVAAINEVDAHADANATAIGILNGADTTAGSVAKSIKDAIAGLDTTADVTIASQSGKAITIAGSIAESDGVIEAGSASNITLADVASTGAAEDVTTDAIDDGKTTPTQLYPAGDVQSVLEAIARNLNDLETESVVNVVKDATAQEGYFASYTITQNGTQVGEKINIPKDYLVKSASVQTVTTADVPYPGAEVGDKYIDFVVNTRDQSATDEHLYIPVDDLMAAISGGTTAEATVAVDAHNVITATINAINASKINYSNTTSGSAVTETVQAALARIDGDENTTGSIKKAVADAESELIGTSGDVAADDTIYGAKAYADAAVAALDATPSQTAGTDGLALSLTEVDGVVTAISGSIAAGTYYDTTNYVLAQASDINALFNANNNN